MFEASKEVNLSGKSCFSLRILRHFHNTPKQFVRGGALLPTMAPSGMDIDPTSTSTTTAKAPPPKKAKVVTPSASSETASRHPDMSLAMSIHRLTMVQGGKLSLEDATSIIGTSPTELLEQVMKRVGTGGQSLAEAMTANTAKYIKVEKGEVDTVTAAVAVTVASSVAVIV